MNIILGNYGNHTIALIQWAHENGLENVVVVNINTGWSAENWPKRVVAGQALSTSYYFQTKELQAPADFAELAIDRGRLPTAKFQWCTTFLKAVPLLSWLDEVDPNGEAIIYLGSRRADSRARYDLPAQITSSDHYNGRQVNHPLYQHNDTAFKTLIARSCLTFLAHQSQECAPCIHSSATDLNNLSDQDKKRWQNLLAKVDSTSCPALIQDSNTLENFDRGCGSFYACGE